MLGASLEIRDAAAKALYVSKHSKAWTMQVNPSLQCCDSPSHTKSPQSPIDLVTFLEKPFDGRNSTYI
eukprot:4252927-Amphidinium_carterae.1